MGLANGAARLYPASSVSIHIFFGTCSYYLPSVFAICDVWSAQGGMDRSRLVRIRLKSAGVAHTGRQRHRDIVASRREGLSSWQSSPLIVLSSGREVERLH